MHRHPPLRLALVTGAVALLLPASAQAQFGRLLNKAKQATLARATNDPPPRFDSILLELGPARLPKVIDGLGAAARILASADGVGVGAMGRRLDEINKRIAVLDARDEGAAYRAAARQHHDCVDAVLDTLRRKREAGPTGPIDMSQQMHLIQVGQQMAMAAQRGDTATAHRMSAELTAWQASLLRKDTTAALARCPVPADARDIIERDSLAAIQEPLADRIREIHDQADSAGAARSAMTREQYAMARERLSYYIANLRAGRPQRGFDDTERSALEAHRAELERLARQLEAQGEEL
jgi:hypothetical protein